MYPVIQKHQNMCSPVEDWRREFHEQQTVKLNLILEQALKAQKGSSGMHLIFI
jgi:hypothetical protein